MPPAASANPATAATAYVLPSVRLDTFEGPFDLLFHLVRQGKMDVLDLPIVALCDQYIAHLSAMEALDLNVAGEFFVMAATLLEIKSRLLLPQPPKPEKAEGEEDGGEGDPRAELVRRLLEYGKYQAIAEALRQAEGDRKSVFFRPPTEYRGEYRTPPRFGELSAEELLRTLERMLATVGAGERAITSVRRQKITLRMKMREVLGASERAGLDGVPLGDLLPEPPFALLEVVLLFLALLELLKVGAARVLQEAFCGEIRVFFVPEPERASLIGEDVEEGRAVAEAGEDDPEEPEKTGDAEGRA
jgi:segregation and condensation protein A